MNEFSDNAVLRSLGSENPQLAEKVIADWKRDPKLRAEFQNNLANYAAFAKADAAGRVKIRTGQPVVRRDLETKPAAPAAQPGVARAQRLAAIAAGPAWARQLDQYAQERQSLLDRVYGAID
ncbi:MAG: hypothetical protein ACTS5I_14730 [Rhodanobacter sp.]